MLQKKKKISSQSFALINYRWNSRVKIKQKPLTFNSHVSTLMYSLLALPTKLLPDIDHRNLTLICTEISRQHHHGSQLENDRLPFTVIDPELPCNVWRKMKGRTLLSEHKGTLLARSNRKIMTDQSDKIGWIINQGLVGFSTKRLIIVSLIT